ncbi:hypothetical protein GCM10027343_42540 [Noviherbaspirillum agri]
MALAAVGMVAALNNGAEQLSSFATLSTPEPLQVLRKDVERKDVSPVVTVATGTSGEAEPLAVAAVATIVSEESKPELQSVAATGADPGPAAGSPAQQPTTTDIPDAAGVIVLAEPTTASGMAPASAQDAKEKKPSALHERTTIRKGNAAVASAKGESSTKTTGKDKDVDLIAALLNHVSSGSKAPPPEGKRKATVTSAGTRASSSGAGMRREQKGGVNRDVVIAGPGETTESLVNRCRALGFFEGELCRLRICSGMWGKDAACPNSAGDQVD